MSKTAPKTRSKKGKEIKKKTESKAKELFGDLAEELELGIKYDGFYEQLHELFKTKFKEDDKSFLEHISKVGDDIELEFPMFDVYRSKEKKKLDDMKYIYDVRGMECSQCGSTRTGKEGERQFRSLDEGGISRFFCANCYGRKK